MMPDGTMGVCTTTWSNAPTIANPLEIERTIAARPGVEISNTSFAPSLSTSSGSCLTEPGPNTTRDGRPL